MLRIEPSAEKLISDLSMQLAGSLRIQPRASDAYAPHVTLAIFQNLVTLPMEQQLEKLAAKASLLSIEFCSVGLFESTRGASLYLAVAPSRHLLAVHKAAHTGFAPELRRDTYYDVGKWLPHCTVASGIDGATGIQNILNVVPRKLFFTSYKISVIEMVFSADPVSGPIETLQTVSVDQSEPETL